MLQKVSIPYIFESADAITAVNAGWIEQLWESARLKMKAQSAKEFILVIDEIQKIIFSHSLSIKLHCFV